MVDTISGADINGVNAEGRTALHLAASAGETAVVNFLLRVGCRKQIKDHDGVTPGEIANINGHRRCAQSILEYSTLPKASGHIMQFLQNQLSSDADERERKKFIANLKKQTEMTAKYGQSTVENLGHVLEQMLDFIPYFKARREMLRNAQITKEAARKILNSSEDDGYGDDDY